VIYCTVKEKCWNEIAFYTPVKQLPNKRWV